jgi:subtilisin-like proprotein convertase family protein
VLDTSARTAYLSNFNGLDPNGQWTLFIADLAAGDRATLVRWGLEIEPERANPVPEGVMTLPILAASLAGLTIARRRGRFDRRRLNKTRPTP